MVEQSRRAWHEIPPQQWRIGWVGLGVMGQAMARRILDQGYPLTLFTRTAAKAQHLLDQGASWAQSPRQVAECCDIVLTMVGFPSDVTEIYFGAKGIAKSQRPGQLWIDMTTSQPDLAREIAAAAQSIGCDAIDAPVSGGDVGATNGTLSIMIGGDPQVVDQVMPLLQIMGQTRVHQGPAGAGQHTKMCNQIAIASNMLGVCESLAYARAAGLDPDTVLQSISSGAAGSWSMSNLVPRMIQGDLKPGFYVKHFIKDLGIALDSAKKLELELPGLKLAEAMYQKLAHAGDDDLGTQALIKLYAQ